MAQEEHALRSAAWLLAVSSYLWIGDSAATSLPPQPGAVCNTVHGANLPLRRYRLDQGSRYLWILGILPLCRYLHSRGRLYSMVRGSNLPLRRYGLDSGSRYLWILGMLPLHRYVHSRGRLYYRAVEDGVPSFS
jgi:hypothetical protein